MTSPSSLPYTTSARPVARVVDGLTPRHRRALRARLDVLVTTLTGAEGTSLSEAVDIVATEVGHAADLLWLAHSVLAAELPTDEEMADLLARARLGGTWVALAPVLDGLADARRLPSVEVLRGVVTCDVHTTAQSVFLSGIQRVVRETTARWQVAHDLTFVGWTRDQTGLAPIGVEEHQRMFGRDAVGQQPETPTVVVPFESTHLWVEVVTDRRRTSRLLALAQHSRNEVGVLGFDAIPITSSVTVAHAMTSHFARGLAAVRRADRVGTISEAAAEELRGVLDMGAGRRDRGPEVAAVPLAVSATATTEADLDEARAGLVVDGEPMVLVIGSHEPRKNHLAVLHAAELLWREGLHFNLVLVGAGSWRAEQYERTLAGLVGAGRPVQSIRGLPDRLLWAAYRLAHCTLFPSLNEGFGLPVAESLAAGTPVITSGFGSMREIVAPHGTPLGGLLVDPRDDHSLVAALRTMLTDTTTYERLRAETARHVERSWDDYAEELWAFLVDGVRPGGAAPEE